MTPETESDPRRRARRRERGLAALALVTLVAAWILGALRADPDLVASLEEAVPGAHHFTASAAGSFTAWADEAESERLAHLRVGVADGYGGPLRVAVALDPAGTVAGLSLVEERETPTVLARVRESGLPGELVGKRWDDPFLPGLDVDAISGATLTSRAWTGATRDASRTIAALELGLEVPPEELPALELGVPEAVLLLLFLVGIFGHRASPRWRKPLRWTSLLIGLVVLGFVYNDPFTLAGVNRLLLGYWPSWRTELYWYLLVGGVLGIALLRDRTPYCSWFCPFGAAQDCLGAVGGARLEIPVRRRELYTWIQRGLAWLAICLGLFYRNPGLTSYEVFGGLFDLVGTSVQFLLLAVVLVASLFLKRPWCRLLCPLRPVTDYLRLLRSWIRETWRKIVPRRSAS